SVFSAMLLAVAGVSIFSLGATFNYLVSLFHRRPMRQGLFGRPLFDPPLDHHFGWMGAVVASLGIATGAGSLGVSIAGGEVTRLWFWLVGSGSLVLIGLQLIVSWVVMRILERLSARESRVTEQLG